MKCDCDCHKEQRTGKQNNSLHLWFEQMATELNDSGYDMKKVIRQEIDIPWTAYTFKEFIWRPVQEAQLGKKSTTQLKTHEIDQIYDTVNRVIGVRTGVYVPFPSVESLEINY